MEEVDLIPSLPVGVSVGLVKNKTNLKEKIKNFFSELFGTRAVSFLTSVAFRGFDETKQLKHPQPK